MSDLPPWSAGKRCFLNEKFIRFIATGCGAGYAPWAPGTAGTLVGLLFYGAFFDFPWPLWLLTLLAFTGLAWRVADEAERLFARKDAPQIVIDEVVGLQWALFLIAPTALHLLLGFALFRLFDIWKPFPARTFQDHLPGGLGIVADDWVAGIYANVILQVLVHGLGL